jgi:hypothetical protein
MLVVFVSYHIMFSTSDRWGQMRASETNMGQASFNEYFDCSTEDSSGPFPLADRYHPFVRQLYGLVEDL